jgi:HK97 family phage major capsid protein
MAKKYEDLLDALKTAKKVESVGFSTPDQVKEYLQEKEGLLESSAKAIEELASSHEAEVGAIKAQLEALKAQIEKPTTVKELSRDDMLANIGKLVSASFRKDFKSMAELGAVPNPKTGSDQEWINPRSVLYDKDREKFVNKDPVGSPFGGTTDGQYVINTIYERELIRYAAKQSAMMGKVRTIPMAGNTISWPSLNRNSGNLYWHTNTQGNPAYREAGKPVFGPRVELTCQTLAGWIPWYDLFQDDIQVNVEIGSLFLEFFSELYGQEFDRQCLFASADPFSGIFVNTGTQVHTVAGASPMSITLDDLTQAPLKVPVQDREAGMWIVSEDFVSWIASRRNALGDYAWMPPQEGGRPGSIAGKPYIEVPSMKSIHEVDAGEPFAWFGDPRKHIWHGNRMGVEIRSFKETESGLLYGEEFIRFRKRDGFTNIRMDQTVLLKTAPRG